MELTILDKSNYFKGLLLLAGKDSKVSKEEREYVISAGKALGFARSFCEDAVSDLLRNEYISQEPPEFSDLNIAKKFITEGLDLALIDSNLDDEEMKFLRETARVNKINDSWYDENVRNRIIRKPDS